MKNKQPTKILSLLLAVIMLLGVMPITAMPALAAEPEVHDYTLVLQDGKVYKGTGYDGYVEDTGFYPIANTIFEEDLKEVETQNQLEEISYPGVHYDENLKAYVLEDFNFNSSCMVSVICRDNIVLKGDNTISNSRERVCKALVLKSPSYLIDDVYISGNGSLTVNAGNGESGGLRRNNGYYHLENRDDGCMSVRFKRLVIKGGAQVTVNAENVLGNRPALCVDGELEINNSSLTAKGPQPVEVTDTKTYSDGHIDVIYTQGSLSDTVTLNNGKLFAECNGTQENCYIRGLKTSNLNFYGNSYIQCSVDQGCAVDIVNYKADSDMEVFGRNSKDEEWKFSRSYELLSDLTECKEMIFGSNTIESIRNLGSFDSLCYFSAADPTYAGEPSEKYRLDMNIEALDGVTYTPEITITGNGTSTTYTENATSGNKNLEKITTPNWNSWYLSYIDEFNTPGTYIVNMKITANAYTIGGSNKDRVIYNKQFVVEILGPHRITRAHCETYVDGKKQFEVVAGDTVTVKSDTYADYGFVKWDIKQGDVKLANENSSETTFVMPNEDVNIRADLGLKRGVIRGIKEPRYGEKPETDASKVSLGIKSENVGIFDRVTAQSVEWFKSDGTKLTGAFEYNKQYTVKIKFKPNKGNYFVNKDTLLMYFESPSDSNIFAAADVTEYTDNTSSITVEQTFTARAEISILKYEVDDPDYPDYRDYSVYITRDYTEGPSHTFKVRNTGTIPFKNFTVNPADTKTSDNFELIFADNGKDFDPGKEISFTVKLKSGLTNLDGIAYLLATYRLSGGQTVTFRVYILDKCIVHVDEESLGEGGSVPESPWLAWNFKEIKAGEKPGYTFRYWKITGVEGKDSWWLFENSDRTSATANLAVLHGEINLEAVWYAPPEPEELSREVKHIFWWDTPYSTNHPVKTITETKTGESYTYFDIEDLSGEGYSTKDPLSGGLLPNLVNNPITVNYYPNEYTLTWDLGSPEASAPDFKNGIRTEQVVYGHMIQGYSYSTKWRGHTFMGWDPKPVTMPARDLTITAIWKDAPEYSLTINGGSAQYYVGPGEYADITDGKAYAGDGIYLTPDAPAPGYKFVRWAVNSGLDTAMSYDDLTRRTYFAMPDNHVEITAIYEEIQYVNVKVINGLATQYDDAGYWTEKTAEAGTDLYLSYDDAPEGYEFDKWLVTKGSVVIVNDWFEGWVCEVPKTDVEIVALYKLEGTESIEDTPHSVTVTGGTASKSSAFFGDVVTITANTPPAGQRFKNWTVNSGGVTISGSNNSTASFIMLNENASVTANFEDIPKYSLTTQVSGGNGSISSGKTNILSGTLETVTFTPDEGYEIDTVTVNDEVETVYDNSLQLYIFGNTTVTVTYKEIPATKINHIEVSGTQVPVIGESVDWTMPTIPGEAGYELVDYYGWLEHDETFEDLDAFVDSGNFASYSGVNEDELTFKEGLYYTLVVYACPKSGFEFAPVDEMSGEIDETEADLSDFALGEGIMTLYRTYGPLEKVTLTGIEIKSAPNQTEYRYKDKAGVSRDGLKVVAHYSNGTEKDVTEDVTIHNYFIEARGGENTATVEYQGKEATFQYTIKFAWWQWLIKILLFGFIWY